MKEGFRMNFLLLQLCLQLCLTQRIQNSIIFMTQNELDPREREAFVANYTKQLFAPIDFSDHGESYPQRNFMFLDTESFFRQSELAHKFIDIVKPYDVKKEMSNLSTDPFQDFYKAEMKYDKDVLNILSLTAGIDKKRIEMVNREIFSTPRSFMVDHIKNKQHVGDYIARTFTKLGLISGFQQFEPRLFHSFFFHGPLKKLPVGTNVFAIYPGQFWGTSQDRVLVIGAHWDTMPQTDGFNDNGSGVTALLELARVIVNRKCALEHSLIFVAFDLEEVGNQGSLEFVRNFLVPSILTKFNQEQIQGAFVLDTLLNFNQSTNSQHVTDSMRKRTPETVEAIEANDNRGDFVNIFRRPSADAHLAQVFQRYWDEHPEADFKLLFSDVDLGQQQFEDLKQNIDFLRSDHARFWVTGDLGFPSFPALVLTDTGPFRGLMRKCYHGACDSVRNGHQGEFANFDFFAKILQTVLDSSLELTNAKCAHSYPSRDEVSQSHSSKLGGNYLLIALGLSLIS